MRHTISKVISCLVFLFMWFQQANSERWVENTLYDLEGEGADFLDQANLWTPSGLKNPLNRVTNCNGNDILGGYNILVDGMGKYWERNWTGLPSHNQIIFYMDFYPVDSWDKVSNNKFQVQFDSKIIDGWILDVYGGVFSHDICGNPGWKDLDNVRTYILLPHNSSSLNFRVISQLDEATDNESFGFRNISFMFATVDTPIDYFCGSTVFSLPNNWCPCLSTRQYMYPAQSGTCYDCDSSCLTCTGANSNQCSSCEDGFYLSSGKCLPCDSTCGTCTGGAFNQCKTCHTGDYLVGNNTCVPVCPEPFYPTTNAIVNFCETPCPSQFAFKNGACGSTCPGPFQPYVLSILKACSCYSSGAGASDPCYSCDISCLTCNGTGANECLTCFDGFYLQNTAGMETGTCEACDSTCATCYGGAANQCNSCFSDAFLVLDGSVNNGTCGNCHSSCLTCDGSTTTDCLSCSESFYLIPNAAPALDGACLACDSTCATCTGSASNECVTCHPGSYLVSNNTCIPDCSNPFFETTNGAIDFCETPCLGKYAFEDQTCTDICTTLHKPEVTAAVLKACICDDYKYQNESCLGVCNSPMTIREQNGKKYCDFDCPTGEYLNYDGTCSPDCGLPSIRRVEGDKLYCDYGGCDEVKITHLKLTPTGHDYKVVFLPNTCDPETIVVQDILNNNQDLKTLLSDPAFIVTKNKKKVFYVELILAESVMKDIDVNVKLIGLDGTLPIPKKLVPSELAQNLKDIADTGSQAIGFVTGSNILTSLSLQNTACAWGFVGSQQFLTFFKYTSIDYPLQLEFFFLLGGATDFSSVPNVIDYITEDEYSRIEEDDDILDAQSPPTKFFYYDVTSFFIKNGGATFLFNWVILGIVLLIILLRKTPKVKDSKIDKMILEKIDDKLRWNFVLRGFLTVGLPQSISILLQMRVLSNQEPYLILCTVLTIIALVHFVSMCGIIFYILWKTSLEDLKKKEVEKRCCTLLQGIKLKSNHAKYYHVLILLRGVLLAIMVVFAEKLSLLQVIMMIAFNVGLVYFLFIKIEFEKRSDTIKNRITETLIIPMEIGFAMLTRDGETESYYNITAWVTFGIIGVMFINEAIFALISQFFGLRKAIRTVKEEFSTWKKNRATKKAGEADVVLKLEEQADILTVEAKSDAMSPKSDSSPTESNNLLESEPLSLDRATKDVTPKCHLKAKINFSGMIKIHSASVNMQSVLSVNELTLEENNPMSMDAKIVSPCEMNTFGPKAVRQTSTINQIIREPTIESLEEDSLLKLS